MALSPVLQIVHVTDLHCKHVAANAVHRLNARRRYMARLGQYVIERHDLFGWNEGTQGHYRRAPESFARFLERWRERDTRWYGPPGGDSPRTWLVDSGDLTAFGDDDSLSAGRGYLRDFRTVLGDCEYRSLYGNHDAWPQMLPAHAIVGYMPQEIKAQRQRISTVPDWHTGGWITDPLTITIPDTEAYGGARIELYAVDTVCWGAIPNTLAVGEISGEDFNALRTKLRSDWSTKSTRHFRILALHHPLAFPYDHKESHALLLIPAMRLGDADGWAREFRNDRNDPAGMGVLIHLFLSGHTHAAHPAGELPSQVEEIYQGSLAPAQLQLVGGPLMLNRSAKVVAASGASPQALVERTNARYVPATLDTTNCQAQILRFFSDSDRPGELIMFRIPVQSVDGSVYVDREPTVVSMPYDSR